MVESEKAAVEPIDIQNCGPEIWWVEDWNWYDWIAYYENINTKQRYSRAGYPIENDEMCRYWYICKVEMIKDGPWQFEYHWKILSRRPDWDAEEVSKSTWAWE